jgi:hypothetical protein
MSGPAHRRLRRAWLSGYDVSDVEVLVAQLRLHVDRLEGELRALHGRLAEAQAREQANEVVSAAHSTAAAARAQADELIRLRESLVATVRTLGGELERVPT